MPVKAETLQVGACYVASPAELRRIERMDGDAVRFTARGRHADDAWNAPREISRIGFAAVALDVAPCDGDLIPAGPQISPYTKAPRP